MGRRSNHSKAISKAMKKLWRGRWKNRRKRMRRRDADIFGKAKSLLSNWAKEIERDESRAALSHKSRK